MTPDSCDAPVTRRSTRLLIATFAVVASLDPVIGAQGPRIEQLGWLAGCWEMSSPRGTIEEQWSAPRGQTMLGTGRTVRDGRTTEYEFVVLTEQDGRFAYEAHPSQQASAVFLSREATASRVVFENLDHDFPQRVGYERQAADAMLAWIEGTQNGRLRRVEFRYRRVACR